MGEYRAVSNNFANVQLSGGVRIGRSKFLPSSYCLSSLSCCHHFSCEGKLSQTDHLRIYCVKTTKTWNKPKNCEAMDTLAFKHAFM